jgi:hypothetical protein
MLYRPLKAKSDSQHLAAKANNLSSGNGLSRLSTLVLDDKCLLQMDVYLLYRGTTFTLNVQPTDHKLIPARSASLAAIQGSASGSNVRYYPK